MSIFHVTGYIEEKDANKYLIFNSADENKEILKKYNEVFDGIRDEIITINDGMKIDYEKDYVKIKFISIDDLPINEPLKFHLMTITKRSIFKEDGKLYPQVF